MTIELTTDQYKSTFDNKMADVTETAEPVVDIWSYVGQLTQNKIVLNYVLDEQLVEKVYRNSDNSFEHVLLPTDNKNIFIIIMVDLRKEQILGHYRLDLDKEYGLKQA